METLDEYNKRMRLRYQVAESELNGIACPNCGNELCDSQPGVVLSSDPPQKDVHCAVCGFSDSVII